MTDTSNTSLSKSSKHYAYHVRNREGSTIEHMCGRCESSCISPWSKHCEFV